MKVDWEEQWALFAQNFYEGKAHIDFGGKTLLLLPGPGFGDLSHPTTSLMVTMMEQYVPNESIIDIGTGSGILALGALLLGAKATRGIDIDLEALKHARKNGKLNDLKAIFSKTLPKKLPQKNIMLMNMISSEQMQVEPQRLNHLSKLWIVSGILKEQREKYLAQTKLWGWTLISERHKRGWLGFIFSYKQRTV